MGERRESCEFMIRGINYWITSRGFLLDTPQR